MASCRSLWCARRGRRLHLSPLACPACHARPGTRCKRPSGHEAAAMHAHRWRRAEALDVENGVGYLGPSTRSRR